MLELKLEAARACWLRRACCEAPYTAVSRHCSPVTQSRLNVWQRIAPGMQGHRWIMHNSMALREEPAGFVELAAKVAKLEIKHVGLESIKGSGVS
jgi:hypothetical protein